MSHQLVVPALGESISEATIARWLKKVGDMVKLDDPIIELETDKVTLEVNAPQAGILGQINVNQGDIVQVGQILGLIQEHQGQPISSAQAQPSLPTPQQVVPHMQHSFSVPNTSASPAVQNTSYNPNVGVTPGYTLQESNQTQPVDSSVSSTGYHFQSPVQPQNISMLQDVPSTISYNPYSQEDSQATTVMSPAARKMAAEHNVSSQEVEGSGRNGRITKQDVVEHLAAVPSSVVSAAVSSIENPQQPQNQPHQPSGAPSVPQMTTVPLRQFQMTQVAQPEERVRMTRLRQRIAERLKEAQNTAAMLTTFNEIDMSHVMATRDSYREKFEKRFGIKLGFMSFFVKAAVLALKEIPSVNAEIEGDYIVYKNHYDIGVAVSSPQGLVVPVVRDADHLNFAEIENAIGQLGEKARTGKLSMSDLSGGTFTITNGGVFGSLMSTPILNPPQSGILGMHKIQKRPIALEDRVEIRPMMYVALTYDHRIIDGREAVTFLVRIKENIEDPQRILLGI